MTKFYDLQENGSNILVFFGIGLSVLILSVVVWFYLMIKGKSLGSKLRIGLIIFLSFIWTMVIWIAGASHYLKAKEALEKGTYMEVEGVVTDFSPAPREGHQNESFNVNGVHFEYSDFEIDYGFQQSKSHGGPIDKGVFVRIHYLDGRILRLWVSDSIPLQAIVQ